jgi:hypothetical protein
VSKLGTLVHYATFGLSGGHLPLVPNDEGELRRRALPLNRAAELAGLTYFEADLVRGEAHRSGNYAAPQTT